MPDDLENELRKMHPTEPSAHLESRIERLLATPAPLHSSSRSDSMLRATLSAALAASVLIVTLLLTDHPFAAAPSPSPANQSPSELSIADTPRLLAQLSDSSRSVLSSPATNPN